MKVLSLKCVNCGAGIEVGPETDTFACSYCGTQQLVKRSGGIVVLQKLGTRSMKSSEVRIAPLQSLRSRDFGLTFRLLKFSATAP